METRNISIISIGAGPAGLVGIIEFIKFARNNPNQSIHLHIIEKRSLESFDRRQKLVNNKKSFSGHTFSGHPFLNWEKYCCDTFNIPANLGLFSTENLSKEEKFIRKLIRQRDIENGKHPLAANVIWQNFSIKELQYALLSYIKKSSSLVPNLHLHWHEKSHLSSIDFPSKTAQIMHDDQHIQISFDHLLNCEGGKRETTSLIKQSLININPLAFTFEDVKMPALNHCAVRLKLKKEYLSDNLIQKLLNERFILTENKSDEILEELFSLGYSGSYEEGCPKFFVVDDNLYKQKFVTKPELRLFVVGEIPDSLYHQPEGSDKRDMLIRWATLLASLQFKLPADYFEFDPHGETEHQINALAFNNKIQYCLNPAIQLKNGPCALLAGDSYINNLYIFGDSSLIALNQAILGVKVIFGQLSIQEYNNACSLMKDIFLIHIEKLDSTYNRNFEKEYYAQQAKPELKSVKK